MLRGDGFWLVPGSRTVNSRVETSCYVPGHPQMQQHPGVRLSALRLALVSQNTPPGHISFCDCTGPSQEFKGGRLAYCLFPNVWVLTGPPITEEGYKQYVGSFSHALDVLFKYVRGDLDKELLEKCPSKFACAARWLC